MPCPRRDVKLRAWVVLEGLEGDTYGNLVAVFNVVVVRFSRTDVGTCTGVEDAREDAAFDGVCDGVSGSVGEGVSDGDGDGAR